MHATLGLGAVQRLKCSHQALRVQQAGARPQRTHHHLQQRGGHAQHHRSVPCPSCALALATWLRIAAAATPAAVATHGIPSVQPQGRQAPRPARISRSHTFDVASSTTTPWHFSSCSATSKPVMPRPHTPTVMRRGSNPTHPLLALGLALGWLGSRVLGPASRSLMCGRRPSRSQANCVLQGHVRQRSGQATYHVHHTDKGNTHSSMLLAHFIDAAHAHPPEPCLYCACVSPWSTLALWCCSPRHGLPCATASSPILGSPVLLSPSSCCIPGLPPAPPPRSQAA